MSDTESTLVERLAAAHAIVTEGARLIDEQIRLIRSKKLRGESTQDADHTLELMIQLQASHVHFRDELRTELKRLRAAS
jgi:hypothetical protein